MPRFIFIGLFFFFFSMCTTFLIKCPQHSPSAVLLVSVCEPPMDSELSGAPHARILCVVFPVAGLCLFVRSPATASDVTSCHWLIGGKQSHFYAVHGSKTLFKTQNISPSHQQVEQTRFIIIVIITCLSVCLYV